MKNEEAPRGIESTWFSLSTVPLYVAAAAAAAALWFWKDIIKWRMRRGSF